MSRRAVVALALAGAFAPPAASAADDGVVVRFGDAAVPDEAALAELLRDRKSPVRTILFPRGVTRLAAPIDVRRDDVTLAGETGRARDATIQCAAGAVVTVRNALRVQVRGVTLRATAVESAALRLDAVAPPTQGFAGDVTVAGCVLEGGSGIVATPGSRALSVSDCTIVVRAAGGDGVVWNDGAVLLVARTRIRTGGGAEGAAGIVVRGASDPNSQGRRARNLVVSSVRVEGNFGAGLDLNDVTDVRIDAVRISFPSQVRPGGAPRIGLAVRRSTVSSGIDGIRVARSEFRRAHTGVWLDRFGDDVDVVSCQFPSCGSGVADTEFGDFGAAVRVRLEAASCAELSIRRNDFRRLASPAGDPAVRVSPTASARSCFRVDDANRVGADRPLHEGSP